MFRSITFGSRANFKETSLRKCVPAQRSLIHVDAYHRNDDGYVESVAGASGARFSLLPPENATGNYVKVVQRVPVRIRFKEGQDPAAPPAPGYERRAQGLDRSRGQVPVINPPGIL